MLKLIHFRLHDTPTCSPLSCPVTSRAQNIFKQAMRFRVIIFHVVPAAMKRQYELLSGRSDLSPPTSNRVRFSQDSQQPQDSSSLVGGSMSRSGTQAGISHTYVSFVYLYLMNQSRVMYSTIK